MEHLQEELDSLLAQLPNEQEVRDRLESLVSVYPFNEYEYIISTLLAVDADMDAPLYVKALASDSQKSFWMNFQQVKPDCCDLFVWVAVWRDVIRYWVLSSHEVKRMFTILKANTAATLAKASSTSSKTTYTHSRSTK